MAPEGEAREALQLLRQFQQVQQQRAQHYTKLLTAFREFASGGPEGPYRHLLAELAPEFSSCSVQVSASGCQAASPAGASAAPPS
jgi:hypothetical protein